MRSRCGLMRRGKSPHERRYHVSYLYCGINFFRTEARHRHITRRPFLEQEFSRSDNRFGMKAAPHCSIVQDIRDRDQRHALMVRHIGPYDRHVFSRRYPYPRVIQGFIESVSSTPSGLSEAPETLYRLHRIDHRGEGSGIRRDNHILTEASFEAQTRHTKTGILIRQVEIARMIG